jgi:hypothetical protein
MTESKIEENVSRKNIRKVAYNLIAFQKESQDKVKSFLLNEGMDDNSANELISDIKFLIQTKNKEAKDDIQNGLYIFFFGSIITGITYLLSDYLRFYIITWGFIIYGIILYVRGLSNRIK